MEYVPLVGLVFFCIFFLVALGFSIKSWRWLNIVAMVFVFAAAVTYTMMFANVMKRNYEGRAELQKQQAAFEAAYAANQLLVYGPPGSAEWPDDSIQGLNHRLSLAVLGRGRVWRDCDPGTFNNGEIVVTTFTPGAVQLDGTPAPVTPNDIRVPSVMFVFKQGSPDANGWELPEAYLGEFQVTKADDQTVTLLPSLVEKMEEVEEAVGSKWTLYELMPGDMHWMPGDKYDVFTGAEAEMLADPNSAITLDAKRTLLETKYMPPEMFDLAADSKEYIDLIDRYTYDGMSTGEIAKVNSQFKANDEELWVRLEVIKDFDQLQGKVDSDATTTDVTASEDFDEVGLAKTPALQFGDFVSIKKGDELLVDKFTGLQGYQGLGGTPVQSLVDQGFAKETEQIFRRTLNDYGTIFHSANLQRELIRQELGDQRRHVQTIEIAYNLTLAENKHREGVLARLEDDGEFLKQDVQLATAAVESAKAALDKSQAREKELDLIIAESIQKLDELEAQWVREADEKTRKAAEEGLPKPVSR